MPSPTESAQLVRKPSPEAKKAITTLSRRMQNFFYKHKEGRISRSRWIECDDTGAKVYIRKGYYLVTEQHDLRCCFCFANIDIPDKLQKQGIFTALLDFAIERSPFKVIYVESVCNMDLVRFLLKRGFKVKEGDEVLPEGTRSYYLDLANMLDSTDPSS